MFALEFYVKGIIQHMPFCVWLLSISIVLVRALQFVVHSCDLFILTVCTVLEQTIIYLSIICWWIFGMLPNFHSNKQCCSDIFVHFFMCKSFYQGISTCGISKSYIFLILPNIAIFSSNLSTERKIHSTRIESLSCIHGFTED